MIRKLLLGALVATACALCACNHAKDANQVAKDTSTAEQKSAERVSEAQQTAAEKEADARKDVRKDQQDLAHVTAVQNEKVADTEAEGAHRVALARCEAMSGDAQKSCRDQADADYEAAKAKARLARTQSDPKP